MWAKFSLLLLMLLLMMMMMVLVTVTLLLKLDDGDDLETHHRHTLDELGRRSGMPNMIFRKTRRGLRARFQTTQARLSGMPIPA